ncbi:hypothetical protein [Arthrobacter sp. NPDC057013]|uniref:hypothetical protein n=1 Tax=Arthrobacter sp. NPDC057013 TaxID=3345999 RepID=UPI00362A05F6
MTGGARDASARLAAAAKDLARATRRLDQPSDSYAVFGDLLDAQRSLEQVLRQLAEWHRSTVKGVHYADHHEESTLGVMTASEELDLAAQQAEGLNETLSRAYGGTSVVRWFDGDEEGDRERPAAPGKAEAIAAASAVPSDLDNTGLYDMTEIFYQHGFNELSIVLRDLLNAVEDGDV